MKKSLSIAHALAISTVLSTSAFAQTATAPDTIVVFDGSGSMWGQINGRAKIEIARETLSTVLSEVPGQTRIGMIAYGHRQKGVCSDIETVVQVGPANRSVPAMIDVANRMQPKGKTPLTDAVRIAADELKSTENAATVILVTDGIETCDADPCALANELERTGVGFTAHVVGFGLSEEEGRQVQCLADNTGGMFLSANNAEELGDALRRTVQAEPIAPNDDDFGDPIVVARNVRFILRDTPEGEQIGIRQLSGNLIRADGSPAENADFKFTYPEANGNSATAILEPGSYVLSLTRDGGSQGGYTTNYAFEIPEGEGEHLIEASLSGALNINVFINPNLPYSHGDPFVRATGGTSPRIWFSVFPIVNGQKALEPIATTTTADLTLPLSAGSYLVQGNLDRTTSAEQIVEVKGGEVTQMDFSFDATRVFVDARDASGAPVKRQTTYWYDKVPSGRNHWASGGGIRDGQPVPFYLPTGQWVVNAGAEGGGKTRSVKLIEVSGDYEDLRLQIGQGDLLDSDTQGYLSSPAYQGCVEMLKVKYSGCLVKKAALSDAPDAEPEPEATPAPQAPTMDESGVPSLLQGLKGTDYVFVDANQNVMLHVVKDDVDTTNATIVLEPAWCGLAACKGERFEIAYDKVDLLFEDGFNARTVGRNAYTFEISAFGTDKEIAVSGEGASRVRFTLFDQIILRGETTAKEQPISDSGELMYGIFSLNEDVSSIDEVVSDYLHVQSCERRQMVLYPDGGIALKRFSPPTSQTENPFKTLGSGQCAISGARYECTINQASSGDVQKLNFTQKALGNNHFEIVEDGKNAPTLAASCFFPGGDTAANEIMPNGRSLADLILEREDGNQIGFSYDSDNRVQR